MEQQKSNANFFSALKWPEFRSFWILAAILVVAFAVSIGSVPNVFLLAQGGGFVIALAITFALIYRTAKTERGGRVEKSEFKNMLLSLDSALIVYDKDFNVLFFNPAAEKLFKLDAGSVVDHKFQPQDVEKTEWRLLAQVVYPSLAPTVIERSEAGEQTQVVDLSFTDPNLELRVSTVSLRGDKGELLGFMKIIRDRTRELFSLKSKSEFLTIASHQLRTPVTEINWGLESLSNESSLNESGRAILNKSSDAARRLLGIVEDLLNIAKIEEGHFGYKFEQADIVEFINNVLSQAATVARKSGVKVYFDKPRTPLPKAVIDAEKLSRAFLNILENAVRYNVENGEVVVRVEQANNGPFLEISVKDTGIGIAPEDLPNLFKKFFRASAALKTQTEGTGLGLYIAKNIIQAHGGKIWVESEPQRGSIFHFTVATDIKVVPQHEIVVEE
jgi:signal transduction histidine kinase